jgi:hypothetical protein
MNFYQPRLMRAFLQALTVFSLLFWSMSLSFAGEITLSSAISRANIQYNAKVDVKAYNISNSTIGHRVNIVRLAYTRDEGTDLLANGEWRYSVAYRLYDQGSPGAYQLDTLEISFIEGEAVYEQVSRFNVAHTHAEVLVLSVDAEFKASGAGSFSTVGSPHTSTDLPSDIRLELQTFTERYIELNPVVVPKIKFFSADSTIAWSFVQGAEEYDLEWVYIDEKEAAPSPAWTSTDYTKPFDFKEPVRVRTTANHYKLDLAYPGGKIYFRVRAVGRHTSSSVAGKFDYIKTGNWGYNEAGNGAGAAVLHTMPSGGFQKDLNWQYQATYAENGKRKSVVSYFDGSSRNRQQQTNLSTEGVTLVGETKYDSEGRGVIQVLPVPKSADNLAFVPNFTVTTGQSSFLPSHFEDGTVEGLSNTTGAGKYYSDQNTFTSNPYQPFTPTSQGGYAFTQVEYLKDNTGKVRRQSGLGSTFQLGDGLGAGRETEYYYGTPVSTELNRLFGSNVGNASHYKKILTIDANEQLSLTYQDQEGRTIATSLVGEEPDNLVKLDSNVQNPITVSLNKNNVVDEDNNVIESVTKIMNILPNTNYQFVYDLEGAVYSSNVVNGLCLDCEYDLLISITDPEGDSVKLTVTQPVGIDSAYTLELNFSNPAAANCSSLTYSPTNGTVNFSAWFTRIGDYTINKRLTVSKNELPDKIEAAITEADLGETYLNNLIQEFKDNIDTLGCLETCAEHCYVKVKADNPSLTGSALDEAVAECEKNCLDELLNDGESGYVLDSIAGKDCDAILAYIVNDTNHTGTIAEHPGFCHFLACTLLVPSRSYDYEMALIEDWTEASTGPKTGYTDPSSTPFKDPFFSMLNAIDPGLEGTFLSRLVNYYPIPGGGGYWSIHQFVDATTNPGLYGTQPATAENKWKLFRGIYLYEKLKLIEQYKDSISCDYDDIPILSPPILPETPALLDAYTDSVQALRTSECDTICKVNVGFWMDDLLEGCSTLTGGDSAAIYQKLLDFCLGNCGDYNPMGLIVKDSLESGNYAELNWVDSVLTERGCTIDSIVSDEPYVWDCRYRTCMGELMDFLNEVVLPNLNANGFTTETICNSTPSSMSVFNLESYPNQGFGDCLDTSGHYLIVYNDMLYLASDSLTCPEDSGFCAIASGSFSGWTYGIDSIVLTDINGVKATAPSNYAIGSSFTSNLAFKFYYSDATTSIMSLASWNPPGAVRYGDACYNTILDCYIVGTTDTNITTFEFPCKDRLLEEAEYNARAQYEDTIQDLGEKIADEYELQCLNVQENFYATYIDNEYQFTLYYYDQAGNLVQTVPPEGVDKLPIASPNFVDGDYQHITQPGHTYKTTYRYNGLNQVVEQATPDGGTTDFWYDKKGQLRFSQNAQQASDGHFSYTKYDDLGRIVEVGESESGNESCPFTLEDMLINTYFPTEGWDITFTSYEDKIPGILQKNYELRGAFSYKYEQDGMTSMYPMERNLRNRVSSVHYYEGSGTTVCSSHYNLEYTTATHYAYDAHGNVKRLIQEENVLPIAEEPTLRTIDYHYDLLSGNVKLVHYQPGEEDGYLHRYYYDADNRITSAYTSEWGYVWDNDANYFYYIHGPLARVEIGEDKVQGVDYAYTLQGWLKAVNSNTMVETRDMGKDGAMPDANTHKSIARDAFGYSIGYYVGDYAPIGTFSSAEYYLAENPSNAFGYAYRNLYNGNIHTMTVALMDHNESALPVYGYEHLYDQLNRIKERSSWGDVNLVSANSWSAVTASPSNAYLTFGINYDRNGNIIELKRRGDGANTMDDLDYVYTANTNKLSHIDDIISSIYNDDLDDQNIGNYAYDLNGNLTQDTKEGIVNIRWNAYGKIKDIQTISGKEDLEFIYDPSGNRAVKIVKPKTGTALEEQTNWTYYHYVRDAQGNVMANYTRTFVTDAQADHYRTLVKQKEIPLYGSSRLGVKNVEELAQFSRFKASIDGTSKRFEEFEAEPTTGWSLPGGGDGTMGIYSEDTSKFFTHPSSGAVTVRLYSASAIDVFSEDVISIADTNTGEMISSTHYRIPALSDATLTSSSGAKLNVFSNSVISFKNDTDVDVECTCASIRGKTTLPPWVDVKHFDRTMGEKRYELTNHLGNVYATVSDQKLGVDDGVYNSAGTQTSGTADDILDYYTADVKSYADYYPFGSLEPTGTEEKQATNMGLMEWRWMMR